MKNILFKSLFIFILSIFWSCTHNNGDIGPYFGIWKLSQLTINGEEDPAYEDNIVWKFQASAISMVRVQEYHTHFESYGTWEEVSPEELRLKFIYSDNGNPEGSPKYSPLPETHLPPGEISLTIVSLSSKRMQLRYQALDGTLYGYKLEKW